MDGVSRFSNYTVCGNTSAMYLCSPEGKVPAFKSREEFMEALRQSTEYNRVMSEILGRFAKTLKVRIDIVGEEKISRSFGDAEYELGCAVREMFGENKTSFVEHLYRDLYTDILVFSEMCQEYLFVTGVINYLDSCEIELYIPQTSSINERDMNLREGMDIELIDGADAEECIWCIDRDIESVSTEFINHFLDADDIIKIENARKENNDEVVHEFDIKAMLKAVQQFCK